MIRLRAGFAAVLLSTAVLLAACSPRPAPWPEPPADLEPISDEGNAYNTLTILWLAGVASSGDEFRTVDRTMNNLGEGDDAQIYQRRMEIVDHYEAQLDDWEELDILGGPIGRAWEYGDQRFTIAMGEIEGQQVVQTVSTQRGGRD